ncbi:MAG TPA: glycerol-3-phosphate 1-O-acyltransferase PlsY [Paracoccaceae bacterium]|nr:glycerol-3-phosphate 1-O-acyltransferase PlsY [Paracoccaceae bacterium]
MGLDRAWPWLLGCLLGGYLLGSIPFGLILARLLGLGDPRRIGSGNIGATNVLRTGHRGAAAATLVLDMAKGFAAVALAHALYGPLPGQIAGLGAFLGHVFSPWLGFRGGKGVATFIGILAGLSWGAGALACLTWLGMAAALRYSSLSALVMALLSPVWLYLVGARDALWLGVLLTIAIFLTHRANIARLFAGTEPRIGQTSGSLH